MTEPYVSENMSQLTFEAGQLSDKIFEEFLKKIGNRACEACGVDRWFIIAQMKVATWKTSIDWAAETPVASVCCGNCGNVRSFAWARIKFFMEVERAKDAE